MPSVQETREMIQKMARERMWEKAAKPFKNAQCRILEYIEINNFDKFIDKSKLILIFKKSTDELMKETGFVISKSVYEIEQMFYNYMIEEVKNLIPEIDKSMEKSSNNKPKEDFIIDNSNFFISNLTIKPEIPNNVITLEDKREDKTVKFYRNIEKALKDTNLVENAKKILGSVDVNELIKDVIVDIARDTDFNNVNVNELEDKCLKSVLNILQTKLAEQESPQEDIVVEATVVKEDENKVVKDKLKEFVEASDTLKNTVEDITNLPDSKNKKDLEEFVQDNLNDVPKIIEEKDKEKILAAANKAKEDLQNLEKKSNNMLFAYNDVLTNLSEEDANSMVKAYPDLKRLFKLLKANNLNCSFRDMLQNVQYGNNTVEKGLIVDIYNKDGSFKNTVILDIMKSIYKGDTAVFSACNKYLHLEVVVFLHETEAVMQMINNDMSLPLKTKINMNHISKLYNLDLSGLNRKTFKNVDQFLRELDKIA